ncbi:receptor-like cytosolic serine/threonine-protein kinase RBK1 isoform X1 [Prosopis cineraria]|uniref:receptor-like cytosolic serine/threonine-protein kinase RBK1 isoform X1 n=1 Tax=Prosopis cineraria TaxID=364024 RepID=UPI00240FCCA9|nr:receptor-like cytosolic serine/threonine-protein kinase RBK1 isoform X1 [Prosopis cineraria]XP_054825446.1 receptor-like cytosolic serine/threonine-protein kinase RBK1 isoform X1 [Prosopis cineraria]
MESLDKHRREFSGDDEASPRGILEIPVSGTESDHSGSSNCSLSSPEKSSEAERGRVREGVGHGQPWKAIIESLKKKSVQRISAISLLAASYEMSRKSLRKRRMERIRSAEERINVGEIPTKTSWRNFDYAELQAATDDFNPENLIGQGGHAEVYKGRLPDGQLVAVKRLMKKEKQNEDRAGDYLSELGIIAHINHPNAVRLIGFGVNNGFYFVLQLASNGSLSSLLFGSECLEWKIRFKVAIGVAQGLRYLHHDCQRRIIHRDIKASNILLNENYEAEISDFGLAKWLPEKWTHHVVFPIEGTFGYLAPEYFMHGIVDEKTDVFAFGVLLLELITGRRAVDSCSKQSLVLWAKPRLEAHNVKELVDPRLGEAYDSIELKRTMVTASMCLHHSSPHRPYMKQVVQLLKGEEGLADMKQKSVSTRSLLLDASDLEEYTCSTYLNDLNRYRQLAMESANVTSLSLS